MQNHKRDSKIKFDIKLSDLQFKITLRFMMEDLGSQYLFFINPNTKSEEQIDDSCKENVIKYPKDINVLIDGCRFAETVFKI